MIDVLNQLPSDVNLESNILGALINYPELITEVPLKATDFYKKDHQLLFKCLKEMVSINECVDLVTASHKLNSSYSQILEPELLVCSLIEASCSKEAVNTLSNKLIDLRVRRDVLIGAETISKKVYDPSSNAIESLNQFQYLIECGIRDIDESESESSIPRNGRIIPIEETFNQFVNFFQNGLGLNGYSTGWEELDKYYKVCKGMLNILTGIPGHGKSEFLDALAVNTAVNHNWNWIVFSPENHPTCLHTQKLIEKYTGHKMKHTNKDLLKEAIEFIVSHFHNIDLHEDNYTLDALLSIVKKFKSENQVDAMIIDPWNELTPQLMNGESETEYVGRSLCRLRRFARKHKICLFVVAHPAKMYKREGATKYDVPTLYNISGSAHWFNKADNGLCVYRDVLKTDTSVQVYIQKVKFKIHGVAGKVVNFDYDLSSGRYSAKSEF